MGPDVSYRLLEEPDASANRIFLPRTSNLIRVGIVLLLVSCSFADWVLQAEARNSRRASAGRTRTTRTTRSAGRGRSQRYSRTRTSAPRAARSRNRAVSAPPHHGPTAAQIRRQDTSGDNDLEKRTALERSYRAYDQGLTEWLAGNYGQAAKYLNESYELYSDFHGARDVLDSLYLYDLGQAAEAAGDVSLAKNSYQRSLRRRPDFSDCCIRLAALLTKNGETALALVYARRLADKNPQDPRAQFLLATMLEKAGFLEEGKAARENFNLLLKGGTVAAPKNQVEQGVPDQPLRKEGEESGGSSKIEAGEKVEKDEFDAESGGAKNSVSTSKENSAGGGALTKPDSESDGN